MKIPEGIELKGIIITNEYQTETGSVGSFVCDIALKSK